jgi:hypothetical protein
MLPSGKVVHASPPPQKKRGTAVVLRVTTAGALNRNGDIYAK